MFRILQLQYLLPILQKDNGTVKQQGRGNPPFFMGYKMTHFKKELKREFVKAFYERLYPLIQEDMFVKAEREEKKRKQLELWG